MSTLVDLEYLEQFGIAAGRRWTHLTDMVSIEDRSIRGRQWLAQHDPEIVVTLVWTAGTLAVEFRFGGWGAAQPDHWQRLFGDIPQVRLLDYCHRITGWRANHHLLLNVLTFEVASDSARPDPAGLVAVVANIRQKITASTGILPILPELE